MVSQIAKRIKDDFRAWSGGFPPESNAQIRVYIDYAMPNFGEQVTETEIDQVLTNWLMKGDDNHELESC